MNVYAYISLVILIGLAIAYWDGRRMSRATGVSGIGTLMGHSIAIGVFVAVVIPIAVARICSSFGMRDTQCIATDDRTVWLTVLYPLFGIPAYAILILVSRTVGEKSASSGEDVEA